jgi:two-component sensor histidine kinase
MLVSELVMNAIRYAFPDAQCGTIRVSATKVAGSLRVVVADDGVGLPPGPNHGPGFGMKLAHAMASQIGGALVAENDRGARFTLVAPLSGR